MSSNSVTVGHVAKIIILGIALSTLDVSTDGLNGHQFLQWNNITRTFPPNITVPEYCLPMDNTGTSYTCEESDKVWGILTLSCIQLPAVVMSLCAALAILIYKGPCSFTFFGLLGLMFVPYPLVVLAHQVAHLFIMSPQMEMLSAILLYGEGSLEASPQLILQNYILMSQGDSRPVSIFQILAICTAYFTIAKTSIELYASESGRWWDISEFIGHKNTYHDSMMQSKTLCEKLSTMMKISPAFLTSLIYRVGCLSIISTMLQQYTAVYISIGIVLSFITAYRYFCLSIVTALLTNSLQVL